MEADDDKGDFSFEEGPAIDVTHSQSVEEEEKSLINALSFKKQEVTDEKAMATNSEWATTQQDQGQNLPQVQVRPVPRD